MSASNGRGAGLDVDIIPAPRKTEAFLWEELQKTADGFGKVYKVRPKT